MSIRLQRSPGTARQIGEMLTKVSTFCGDVELVTIGRRNTIGYSDTGLSLEIEQDDTEVSAPDLVSEVVRACREHAVELGDAWYQATFLSAEREHTVGRGKNASVSRSRTTLGVCAFPIGDADATDSPRTAAKAQIESEAAVAIRTISDFTSNIMTKMGDQLVSLMGAAKGLIDSQAEVAKQIGAQQKGYVTQGETLVELVKMNHAHQLAMAEAEASNKHAEEILGFAQKVGFEWLKSNIFNKTQPNKGFTPDPAKCSEANIIGDVMFGLSDQKKAELIELIGQDAFDLIVASSKVATTDEVRAILLRLRETWAERTQEEMQAIATGIPRIIGADAIKLYAVLKDMGVTE